MELQITEANVLIIKQGEAQKSLFNLLNEFYKSETNNRDNFGRVEIAQAVFYDLALFIKDGEYDNEEIQDSDDNDGNDFVPTPGPIGGTVTPNVFDNFILATEGV